MRSRAVGPNPTLLVSRCGRPCGLDADVERARRAALDPRREAAAHEAVVRGALRDGELGHRGGQLVRRACLATARADRARARAATSASSRRR